MKMEIWMMVASPVRATSGVHRMAERSARFFDLFSRASKQNNAIKKPTVPKQAEPIWTRHIGILAVWPFSSLADMNTNSVYWSIAAPHIAAIKVLGTAGFADLPRGIALFFGPFFFTKNTPLQQCLDQIVFVQGVVTFHADRISSWSACQRRRFRHCRNGSMPRVVWQPSPIRRNPRIGIPPKPALIFC